MQAEYNDEFTISFEREILKNLAFDTTFIYRIINTSYMEDVNAVFTNGAFTGRVFPDFDTIWMRTWYGGDDRRWKFDYKGLQFNIKRNFTGRWGMMANYSLMWRKYYKLAFDPTDPKQFVYASPSDLDMNNYGIGWAVHVSAFYRLPWDILVSDVHQRDGRDLPGRHDGRLRLGRHGSDDQAGARPDGHGPDRRRHRLAGQEQLLRRQEVGRPGPLHRRHLERQRPPGQGRHGRQDPGRGRHRLLQRLQLDELHELRIDRYPPRTTRIPSGVNRYQRTRSVRRRPRAAQLTIKIEY